MEANKPTLGDMVRFAGLTGEEATELLRQVLATPKETTPPKDTPAAEFLKRSYRQIGLLSEMTPEQIMIGFILKKLGIISRITRTTVRESVVTRDFRSSQTIAVYDYDAFTPDALEKLVETSSIKSEEKGRLKAWGRFLDHYRTDPQHTARAQQQLIRLQSHLSKIKSGEDIQDLIKAIGVVSAYLREEEYEETDESTTLERTVARLEVDEALGNLNGALGDIATVEDKTHIDRMFDGISSSLSPKPREELVRDSLLGKSRDHSLARPHDIPINDALHYVIASNTDPAAAYTEGQRVLDKFFNTSLEQFSDLVTVSVPVPVLKSPEHEPDLFNKTTIELSRLKITLLKDHNFTILIGGPPHSGKSTLATRLTRAARRRILLDITDGILDPLSVSVEWCDLDLISPSSDFYSAGLAPARNNRRWDQPLLAQAEEMLKRRSHAFNIVFADLPGGTPDDITRKLVACGDYSILVHPVLAPKLTEDLSRSELQLQRDVIKWKRLDLPGYVVNIQTILEADRQSGLRSLQLRTDDKRASRDFMEARVTNLNGNPNIDDPVIDTLAAFFLYGVLPNRIIRQERHRNRSLVMAGEMTR